MRRLFKVLSLPMVAAMAFASYTPAKADEFTDVITEILELYEAGEIGEAAKAMDYANQLLSQMKAGALQDVLPPPMEGWSFEEISGDGAAMAFMGGISTAGEYRKDNEDVTINIMGDSPMIQQFGAIMGNAAMVQSSGGKLIRVKRQTGMVTQDGEVQMLIGNRFLIMIGGNADEATKIAYLEAIDFDALTALP
ncbi:MAG: hypothetical protein AAF530_04290 [Pseudomonadota bacterium]